VSLQSTSDPILLRWMEGVLRCGCTMNIYVKNGIISTYPSASSRRRDCNMCSALCARRRYYGVRAVQASTGMDPADVVTQCARVDRGGYGGGRSWPVSLWHARCVRTFHSVIPQRRPNIDCRVDVHGDANSSSRGVGLHEHPAARMKLAGSSWAVVTWQRHA
jgi:hypothetical protein